MRRSVSEVEARPDEDGSTTAHRGFTLRPWLRPVLLLAAVTFLGNLWVVLNLQAERPSQASRSAVAIVISVALFLAIGASTRVLHRRSVLVGLCVVCGWYGAMQGMSAWQLGANAELHVVFRATASLLLVLSSVLAGVEAYLRHTS